MRESLTVCPDGGNGSEDSFSVAQKLVSVEYNRISTSRIGRSQLSYFVESDRATDALRPHRTAQ